MVASSDPVDGAQAFSARAPANAITANIVVFIASSMKE
jgi:hypothetical protein